MNDVHVVFGTGAIGLALIDELAGRGVPVRAVNRSGSAGVPDGVEVLGGDVSDRDFAVRAATGAAVVYQCLNPAYHRWAEDFPALQDSAVHAARSVDARLVSFENVYMYGDTGGESITETTLANPHTRKGKVRLVMAEQLRRLHDDGELAVTTARASDYFGPRGATQSPFGDLVIGAALAGKPARVIGNPDLPHSYTYTADAAQTLAYTYTADAAQTLAALGTRDDVLGEVFHVPNAPALTTRQIIDLIADELGSPIKVSIAPRFLLRVMGLFNKTLHEVDEMLYEFTQPFVVDGAKAQSRLGIAPTPMADAIGATVAWFRDRHEAA